jgi:ABC-type transport system involved in cytochrome bd biosynthesis fused ATPase/permease subunit
MWKPVATLATAILVTDALRETFKGSLAQKWLAVFIVLCFVFLLHVTLNDTAVKNIDGRPSFT